MVNNSVYFDNLIITCTLIRNNGIVPSLLEFQQQLQSNIQSLLDELKSKHYSANLLDAFCRLTCLVLDTNIQNMLLASNMRWSGFELEQLFYGYQDTENFTASHQELLFTTQNSEISYYSKILAAMSPNPKINKGLAVLKFKNPANNPIFGETLANAEPGDTVPSNATTIEPIFPKATVDARFQKRVLIQVMVLIAVLSLLWLVGLALFHGENL